jgi:D-arginine dehydrogenase
MSRTVDIVVIGGGIAGMSAAAELSRDAQVLVLEAEDHLGYHSTGRSAAIFIRNYGNATLRRLNALAYPDLAGELLGETVLSPRGEMLIARLEDMETFDSYLADTDGMERLSPGEAQSMVPILRREKIAAAAIERYAQDIDVDRLLQGCARLLRARGGQIATGKRLTGLSRDGSGWRVECDGESILAGRVVNAAGAWADRIAAMAGVAPIGLQPMRRSAVRMALPRQIEGHADWPLFGSIMESWYAKPDGDGLMISPADEDPVDPHDAWPDDMVIAEGLFRFEEMVDVPIVKPSHSWAGLRSFVADRTPVVGAAADADGFYWLAGQGGYGVQTAPALARILADICLTDGRGTEPDLRASLSPARLA